MCKILPSAGIAVDPTGGHSASSALRTQRWYFLQKSCPATENRNGGKGAQSHQFVPLLLVVMATSLETKSTDSQK